MKYNKKITFITLLLVPTLLYGCTNNSSSSICNNGGDLITEEEYQKTEFLYKNIDLSGFQKIDEKIIDIDNDNNNELIELWGKGEPRAFEKAFLLIKNSTNDELLTSSECEMQAKGIGDVGDITGDGIKDICLTLFGGNTGNYTSIYTYKNKEYIEEPFDYINTFNFKYVPNNNFMIDVLDENTKLYAPCEIHENIKDSLIENNLYNDKGNPVNILNNSGYVSGIDHSSIELKDVDGDSIDEMLITLCAHGECHSQSLISFVSIYKYDNDKYNLYSLKSDDSKIYEKAETYITDNNLEKKSNNLSNKYTPSITIDAGLELLKIQSPNIPWIIKEESNIGDKPYYFYSINADMPRSSVTTIDPVTKEILSYYSDGSLINSKGETISIEFADWQKNN